MANPQMTVKPGQVAGYIGAAAEVAGLVPPAIPSSAGVDFVKLFGAGVPAAGAVAAQTLTFGGTPDGGDFTLVVGGQESAAIDWSATNNTLRDNVDAALEALIGIGTNGIAVAVGTMTAGVGTLTLTFPTKGPRSLIAVGQDNLTGTDPTLVNATTTPGTFALGQGHAGIGSEYTDQTNANLYLQAGTKAAPVWKLVTRAA